MKSIDHMHRNGIFHRDIKPENILLTEDHVKLADFGIACKISTSLYRSKVLSSPGYEAPECLQGDRKFDQTVDSYALGVVLFNLVTGKMPYPGKDKEVI